MNIELIKQNVDKYKNDYPKTIPMFVCNPINNIPENMSELIGCEVKQTEFMPVDTYLIMDSKPICEPDLIPFA